MGCLLSVGCLGVLDVSGVIHPNLLRAILPDVLVLCLADVYRVGAGQGGRARGMRALHDTRRQATVSFVPGNSFSCGERNARRVRGTRNEWMCFDRHALASKCAVGRGRTRPVFRRDFFLTLQGLAHGTGFRAYVRRAVRPHVRLQVARTVRWNKPLCAVDSIMVLVLYC